jgi:hypothetical protein
VLVVPPVSGVLASCSVPPEPELPPVLPESGVCLSPSSSSEPQAAMEPKNPIPIARTQVARI